METFDTNDTLLDLNYYLEGLFDTNEILEDNIMKPLDINKSIDPSIPPLEPRNNYPNLVDNAWEPFDPNESMLLGDDILEPLDINKPIEDPYADNSTQEALDRDLAMAISLSDQSPIPYCIPLPIHSPTKYDSNLDLTLSRSLSEAGWKTQYHEPSPENIRKVKRQSIVDNTLTCFRVTMIHDIALESSKKRHKTGLQKAFEESKKTNSHFFLKRGSDNIWPLITNYLRKRHRNSLYCVCRWLAHLNPTFHLPRYSSELYFPWDPYRIKRCPIKLYPNIPKKINWNIFDNMDNLKKIFLKFSQTGDLSIVLKFLQVDNQIPPEQLKKINIKIYPDKLANITRLKSQIQNHNSKIINDSDLHYMRDYVEFPVRICIGRRGKQEKLYLSCLISNSHLTKKDWVDRYMEGFPLYFKNG